MQTTHSILEETARSPAPHRSEVRAALEAALVTDDDLDAFCWCYFPEVKQLFSSGMTRTQKLTLLLEREGLAKVAEALAVQQTRAPARLSTELPGLRRRSWTSKIRKAFLIAAFCEAMDFLLSLAKQVLATILKPWYCLTKAAGVPATVAGLVTVTAVTSVGAAALVQKRAAFSLPGKAVPVPYARDRRVGLRHRSGAAVPLANAADGASTCEAEPSGPFHINPVDTGTGFADMRSQPVGHPRRSDISHRESAVSVSVETGTKSQPGISTQAKRHITTTVDSNSLSAPAPLPSREYGEPPRRPLPRRTYDPKRIIR